MARKPTDDAHTDAPDAAGSAQRFDRQFAQAMRDSAQQIWQAGLGAFAKAQGEGSKVFDSLVEEGVSIQRKTQAAAEETLGGLGQRMTRLSDEMQQRAGQQWDKLEAIFEQRVAKALDGLDAPRREELAALEARIEALSAEVARLARRPAGKSAGKSAGTSPAKPATAARAPRKSSPKASAARPARTPRTGSTR